jgi:hypothetical protein
MILTRLHYQTLLPRSNSNIVIESFSRFLIKASVTNCDVLLIAAKRKRLLALEKTFTLLQKLSYNANISQIPGNQYKLQSLKIIVTVISQIFSTDHFAKLYILWRDKKNVKNTIQGKGSGMRIHMNPYY